MPRIDFSARGRGRVFLWTTLGTLLCIAAALVVDSFNFMSMPEPQRTRAILINILLPTALAVPMLLFLTSKLRELAIAHHELGIRASTDSLTSVLNRGTFTAKVEAQLQAVRKDRTAPTGALLVLDADNFKEVNDRFGHDWGDVALRLIAGAITSSLRSGDLVGRLGGEEFGIFLPGAGSGEARDIAERIRLAVARADFRPEGRAELLSASVGGAVFSAPIAFRDLFRVADRQLYRAKDAGRNRVEMAPAEGGDMVAKAA